MSEEIEDQLLEDQHLKVIIAAAVAAVCGPQAHVRQIRAFSYPVSSAWSRQGRMVIQSSHDTAQMRWTPPVRGSRES
jgi:hypothetical protein